MPDEREQFLADLDAAFMEEQARLAALFRRKNREHDASFFRGDLADAYFNLRRKWHRTEAKLRGGRVRVSSEVEDVASLREDLDDLAVYSVMGLVILRDRGGPDAS